MTLAFHSVVSGQVVHAQTGVLPWAEAETLEETVRWDIADRWGVPPEDVFLEWGLVTAESPGEDAEVRVVGGGRQGYWVASFRAPDSNVWIKARVRAGMYERVAVAARDLPRGTQLTPEDIVLEDRPAWGAPDARGGVPEMTGWRTARFIRAGEELSTPSVRPEDAIRSGDAIQLVWEGRSVSVSVEADAMGSGRVGETITVRVHQNRRLPAVIVAPGVARVVRPGLGGQER